VCKGLPRSASDRGHIVDFTLRLHSVKYKTDRDREANSYTTDNLHQSTLHSHRLSEYQLSLPPHTACYYIQTGHGERGKVGSSESVAAAVCSGVVCCVGRH